MVLNPNMDVLSVITCGGCNFQGDNHIVLYLNVFKHFLYLVRVLQVAWNETEMMHPPKISSFFDDNNHQIVNNFLSILFNTQLHALRRDDKICTFRNVMLDSLL